MARLRPCVLRFPREDGGLDLLDLLLDTIHSLGPDEARAFAALEAGSADSSPAAQALSARLDAALLWEGPVADAIRAERYHAKTARQARIAPCESAAPWVTPPGELPRALAPAWRDPERYRRLREERLAGRELFVLRGLLAPDLADALADEARGLLYQRLETDHLATERCLLGEELAPLQALMRDPVFRVLVGQVFGVVLSDALVLNAWRLGPGDRMAVHPDGPRYQLTLSLGLSPAWTAAQGGAIAFGQPGPEGLEVSERFLPHLGDACLFAPHARSWHAVEPVRSGRRASVTGWWV